VSAAAAAAGRNKYISISRFSSRPAVVHVRRLDSNSRDVVPIATKNDGGVVQLFSIFFLQFKSYLESIFLKNNLYFVLVSF
jgi:hypothetical protein